jgi:hypothetical protein
MSGATYIALDHTEYAEGDPLHGTLSAAFSHQVEVAGRIEGLLHELEERLAPVLRSEGTSPGVALADPPQPSDQAPLIAELHAHAVRASNSADRLESLIRRIGL